MTKHQAAMTNQFTNASMTECPDTLNYATRSFRHLKIGHGYWYLAIGACEWAMRL